MRIAIGFLLLAAALSCKPSSSVNEGGETDEVIAQVGQSILYKSNISELYKMDVADGERDVFIKGFVSNWIRDQLMIQEAEKSIRRDINIDALVKDYRSSLILNYYENKLVKELLDTFVSQDQLKAYYENAKNEFVLSESILKGIVFKVKKPSNLTKIKKAFKDNNIAEIYKLCEGQLEMPIMGNENWYSTSEILSILPSNHFNHNKISKKGDHSKKIGEYEYFVKTIDFVDKNQVPPLEYIDSKITQIILNNRKKALIKRKKQQLYDQNYQHNNIKININ